MELKVLTNDEDFAFALPGSLSPDDQEVARNLDLKMSAPQKIPGAMHGWFEVLCTLGVVAIPASVIASLIASVIWKALPSRLTEKNVEPAPKSQSLVARLILRNGNRTSELEINLTDKKAFCDVLEAALRHVNIGD